MIETYGTDRILANSAGDWGHSDPLAIPELIFEWRARGHADDTIRKVVRDNPLAFWSGSSRFQSLPHKGRETPAIKPASPA
jgi:predicted metal-dependent TIM-barrel fold hydrolase